MRYIAALLTLSLVLIMEGCIPSLYPLYTDMDVVFDPAFLGEWVSADHSKTSLSFTKGNKNQYELVFTDDESKKTTYAGVVLRLGDKLFMDVKQTRSECDCLALQVHMFFFVSQVEPTLKISGLDSDWLEKFLKKSPRALGHEHVDQDIVLTAPPQKLQSFVLRHLNTKGAFSEPLEYVRKNRGIR